MKDFAELAGVSVQSVYQKLNRKNSPLQRYARQIDGVRYIDRQAYDILYAPCKAPAESVEPSSDPAPTAGNISESPIEQSPVKNSTERLLDLLEQQLEDQRRQLLEKDRQISAANDQIHSLLSRLEDSSRIITQQQQLTAMNLLHGGDEPEDSPSGASPESPEPTSEHAEKKSFFSRIFQKH